MSLLKSKFFLGALVAVVAVFGFSTVSNAAYMHSTTLKMGMTSSQVMSLQQTLNMTSCKVAASGTGSMGMESSYFGGLTKAAVMCFQTANALTADGIVGSYTGGKLQNVTGGVTTGTPGCPTGALFNSMTGASCTNTTTLPSGCTSSAGFSTTTGVACNSNPSTPGSNGPLMGTAGEISDVNKLSQYNDEEVGAGQNDVKVLGFDVKASKEGDIALKSTKVSFAIANASGSRKLDDYVDSVSVWMGSTKVGSADAVDFNKDNTGEYSKTISLTDVVVKSDETEKFYVTVDALSNLDSGDIDSEVATIGLDNIRFEDGSGVVTTDTTAGDLAISGVGVKFVSFSTASNTELKISTNSTPVASIVKASTTANTDGVELLKGKMKLDGTSDVWLDEVPFTFVTVGGTSIDDVAGSVTLTIDGNDYTESLGTNCTPTCASNTTAVVVFDNLDLTLNAGDTVNFTVTADINDINGGAFDQGDSLKASLLTTNRDDIVAENEDGDQLADSTEMSGSALGEAQSFRSTGVILELVSTDATVAKGLTTAPDIGTYTMTVDVTAFGGDMWVDGTKPTLAGTNSIDLDIIPGTGGTGTQDATIVSKTASGITLATMTGTINTTSRFYVPEGETKRFTITSVVTPTVAGGLYSVALASFAYNTADVDITDALPALEYTTNLSGFVTPAVNLVLAN